MAKEGEQLSSSVIHRLESGERPVTVSAIYRFAQVLGVTPKDLLDFDLPRTQSIALIALADAKARKGAFKTHLPLFSLSAAAGAFGRGESVEALGWIDVSGIGRLTKDHFVVQARGRSMEPKIHDGDALVMRANPPGSRQGKIVLVESHGVEDPDTGGSYVVKEYHSTKSADGKSNQKIQLRSLNPSYEPLTLSPNQGDDLRVIGELIAVLGPIATKIK